jgi:GR25 family glycosyltransferase involved in LPS biosynthesis
MKSHEKIIKIAIKEKYEKVVVFEDDIYIENPEETMENLSNLLQEKSYDI